MRIPARFRLLASTTVPRNDGTHYSSTNERSEFFILRVLLISIATAFNARYVVSGMMFLSLVSIRLRNRMKQCIKQ